MMHAVVLALWLGASTETHNVAVVDVDVIELNHILNCIQQDEVKGQARVELKAQSHYWVFWSWMGDNYHVRDWCQFMPHHQVTERDGSQYLRVVGANGTTYVIRAKVLRETWTFHDREREDARVFPVDRRNRIDGLRR